MSNLAVVYPWRKTTGKAPSRALSGAPRFWGAPAPAFSGAILGFPHSRPVSQDRKFPTLSWSVSICVDVPVERALLLFEVNDCEHKRSARDRACALLGARLPTKSPTSGTDLPTCGAMVLALLVLKDSIAIGAFYYRECLALRARHAERVSKGLPGPVFLECQKRTEKVEKISKRSLSGTFSWLFSGKNKPGLF